jgi:hypothetical protein
MRQVRVTSGVKIFDGNNDGIISENELHEAATKYSDSVHLNILLKRLIIAILVAAAVTIGCLSAVVVLVVRQSIQFRHDSSVMVTSDTGEEVQCASTDSDLFLQDPVYTIDTVSSSERRRLQSGYCGTSDCDDEINTMISSGYSYVAQQSASQTFAQLVIIQNSGMKVASISMAISSSETEMAEFYATSFKIGVEGFNLTSFKVVPVDVSYTGEAYAVVVPPQCAYSSLSDGCISPILRYPVSVNESSGRRARRLVAPDSQDGEGVESTVISCQEAYNLFESDIHAPRRQAVTIPVQYGDMDLTVAIRAKRHLLLQNTSIVKVDVIDSYFVDEDFEGELSCNDMLHPGDPLCSDCFLTVSRHRQLGGATCTCAIPPVWVDSKCCEPEVSGYFKKECPVTTEPVVCTFYYSCFSGSQTVEMEGGEMVQISDVQIGNRILSMNSGGEMVYSDVVYLPHLKNNRQAVFISLSLSSSLPPIVATPDHLILAGPCDETKRMEFGLKKMSDIVPNMCIQTASGSDKVISVDTVVETGLYTVVTNEEFIVVNGVVASPFADYHQLPHMYYNLHRSLYVLSPSMLKSDYMRQLNDLMSTWASYYTTAFTRL